MGDNNNNVEIPTWLKDLPLAPEFRPTDTEFADPIAYISRIEKEASAFGICKIIPPLPKPSKKYVFGNLNKSLSKCPELGCDVNLSNVSNVLKMGCHDSGNDGNVRAVFTTRHQELGQSARRTKGLVNHDAPRLGVHKQVWQSGQVYTLEQFESKSKAFARSLLGVIKDVSPLGVEALFWKAALDKPIYVEYANDVPGSGFGEPEAQFQYFHRRRRKMTSWKSYRTKGRADCKNNEIENERNSLNDETRYASVKNDPTTCSETSNTSTTSSSMPLDENSRSSRRKSVNGSNDVEGTAGWKLSNSPWNLQVIARSPGSLTRFMPDDIPGVTSPMVYIGMLFSWFAWHVEDHELHSMNFLHTGAPKTWYAVPGDYVFTFEEVIRNEAYGGNIDRLAALSLLGEKTTLLSPEAIVTSGIPCCRLIQNPGEFVVTFPRAYHVGFSHGFNCGEAANFGTPQWLKVAKEAAVRRAAMNYLPMLSHQQLLYLLTMSFIARVPRSLLPGARSSRLRNRQKEERELSVKKAFLEDILKENNTLSVLLELESTFYAVLWHPDLLPCSSKDSKFPTVTDVVTTTPGENVSHIRSEKNNNQKNLLNEMSLCMETLNDLYLDDDDLSCDFQLDSGSLPCVACGILGFPFMSVVQPSERASIELQLAGHDLVRKGARVSEPKNIHSWTDFDGSVKSSVSEDQISVPDNSVPPEGPNDMVVSSITKLNKRWNTSNKCLRPRIFCLEHAVQIEELLRPIGGANILVICHSDHQKIKAHAAAIAEEIGNAFNYSDVPLDSASQEDMHLIDLAIADEELYECGEDWTSKLGINLRHCVKVRKNSPSKQVQHALSLGGLFSDKSPSSVMSKMKWKSRRSRSKIKPNHPAHSKPCQRIENKTDELLREKLDVKVKKIIQYSRRKFKLKPDCSYRGHTCPRNLLPEDVSDAASVNLDMNSRYDPEINPCNIENIGSPAGLVLSPIATSERFHEVLVLEATRDLTPSRAADSLVTSNLVVDSVGHTETKSLEEMNMESKTCYEATCSTADMQQNIKGKDVISEKNEISGGEKYSSQHVIAADDRFEMQRADQITNETSNMGSEGQYKVVAGKDVLMNGISYLANTASPHVALPCVENFHGQMEDAAVNSPDMNSEVHGCLTSDNEVQHGMQAIDRNNDQEPILCDDKLIINPSLASTGKTCAAEFFCKDVPLQDNMQYEINIANGANEEAISSCARLMYQLTCVSPESCQVCSEKCAAADLCMVDTMENEEARQEVHATNSMEDELVLNSVTRMEVDQPSPLCCAVCRGTCPVKNLCADVTINPEIQITTQASVGELFSSLENKGINHASEGACCEVADGMSGEENLRSDVTTDNEVEEKAQTQKDASNKELRPSPLPIPAVILKYSRTRRASSNEVSLSKEKGEVESKESTMEDGGSNVKKERKRKQEEEQKTDSKSSCNEFIKSPCEGLRPRAGKDTRSRSKPTPKTKMTKLYHKCDVDGCRMSFETKKEVSLHKSNRCHQEGCGKRFSSHRYAITHQRVHEEERPLKCTWKGCSMSFKWGWARTEHMRVHTGERPYKCKVEGCGLSFRFVSDYSRHRRKTGHYASA